MKKNYDAYWCSTCLNMSTRNRIVFDEKGRCNACVWSEEKKTLDWSVRESELKELFNYHKNDSPFDLIVPVSGGKDGSYVSYNCREKYGLNPLCVTVHPPTRSEIGHLNLENFKKLLGDGSQWGVKLNYSVQEKPEGIAQSLIIADKWLKSNPVVLILGDNLFFGPNLFSKITSQNGVISLFGGGKQIKSVVNLIDVVRCMKFMEENEEIKSDTFNVTKETLSVKKVAEICKTYNPKITLKETNDEVPNLGFSLSNKKLL